MPLANRGGHGYVYLDMINSRAVMALAVPIAVSWVPVAAADANAETTGSSGEVPVVAISAPDPGLAPPDPLPDGLRIEEISVPDASARPSPEDLLGVGAGAQTLYRDDAGERWMVVARTESSDTGGGIAAVGAGELIELPDGLEASLLEIGQTTIVGWDESDADDCDVCYQTGVVAGRGLTTDELLAAATAAMVLEPVPTLAADAIPDGLRAVSTAPLLDPFEDLGGLAERILVADADGDEALVFVYGGGAPVAEHLAFWIDDGTHVGAALGTDALVTTVDDAAVLAVSFGIDHDLVAEFVDGLWPADPDELSAVVAEVQQAPVTPADNCLSSETDPEHTAVLGGTTSDGARWVAGFGLQPEDGDITTCHEVYVDGEQFGAGSSSGSAFEPPADPATIDVGSTGVSWAEGGWWIARGTVTADADSVLVTFAGTDEPLTAQLAHTGPADGWRWFAIATPATHEGRPAISAVALDAAGQEIASGATENR
jgi:hypothetical protein